jgi:hypothetical protein
MGALAGAADLLFGPSHVETVRVMTVNNARINANLNPRFSGCCAIFPSCGNDRTLGGGTAEMYELLHTRKHYWSNWSIRKVIGRKKLVGLLFSAI